MAQSLRQLIALTHPSVNFLKTDHESVPLVFNRSLGTGIDQFGNPTGRESFTVLAHLYIVNSIELTPSPGQGQQSKIYRGHAMNPKFLPAWIVPGSAGNCTIGGRNFPFNLRSIDRTSMPAYSEAFGERLELEMFSTSKSI
jgi:hypothetical protein